MRTLRRILAGNTADGNPGPLAMPPVPRRSYLVAKGDTLWKIAKREYGDPTRWHEIFSANRRLLKPLDLIHPGMTLRLP